MRPGPLTLPIAEGTLSSRTSASPTPGPRRCCHISALVSRRGTRSPWWGAPARASQRWRGWSTGRTTYPGGRVLIDGKDIRSLTLESLRARVGVVADEPFLFSVSIRDNIAYGRPDASPEDVAAAACAAGADEFIAKLPDGYDTMVGERGYTLSGGQRQRIALARTLLLNPPVLVLDDAMSAIDVQVEHRIHAALRGLMASRTTLIIAHRLATIGQADWVALVEDGRIAARLAAHQELLKTDARYAEVLAKVTAGNAS